MTETAMLLTALRERHVKLWVEDEQLKCSAPAGALDASMRAALASRKDELIALLRQAPSGGVTAASAEESSPTLLASVSRRVPEPVIPARQEQMAAFVQVLRECGYDLANCATRLGVFPRLGVNFWNKMRSGWKPRVNDPVDSLISLFIDGMSVDAGLLSEQFSSSFVDAAIDMRLVEKDDGLLRPNLCLFPCFGKYIVTDQAEKNTALNQVMFLWGESFILAGLVKRTPRRRGIDLGTGSGVHALLASDHCTSVVGADVSPRALAFSKFNAALNGKDNLEFVRSDLLNSIGGTCDLLVANVPYAPDTAAKAGDNFWSGGLDGTELLRRVVEALPTRLDSDGVAHINSLFPNPPGTLIKNHFDFWLGGKLGEWEVLDHTWPVPRYQDLLSDAPYDGDKSAWRFGVVSLRRSKVRSGWKEVAGRGRFFRSDGSSEVIADHDAY